MKNYKNLFFDLDGTLTNSYEGIKNALNITLDTYGVKVDEKEFRTFIGPPLTTSFATIFPQEKVEEAIVVFRKYYTEKGILENEVYSGMKETLARLKSAGKNLYVATSKRHSEAMRVIDYFGLNQYFSGVFGAIEGQLSEKEDILGFGCNQIAANKEDCLMIGDTMYDLRGAQICGIDCMICTYGFGNYENLRNSNAIFANSPAEIADILL